MSATSFDAIQGNAANRLKIGTSTLDAGDPTEDIADEVTSELAGIAASNVTAPAGESQGADPAEVAATEVPAAGTILRDRYVLESMIGSGGTAVVFRAADLRRDAATGGGHPVAVKLLRPELRGEQRSIARLQREFRQTQTAAHPNVVRFHDLDCDRGSWFIVMELLAGETLAARLRRAAPAGLPASEAIAIAAGVADALAHAHALGIIHGDVKPANVFLTDAGETRLLDFGVAPEPNDPPEPTAGTRSYASPEVLGGGLAEAADDVFSLACVACEMLTGVRPLGRGGADAAACVSALPSRPAALDDIQWQVLVRALDPGRPARPGMKEFAVALRGAPAPAESAPATVAAESAVPAAAAVAAATALKNEPVAAAAVSPATPARRTRLITGGAIAAGLMLVLGILIGRLDPGVKPAPTRSAPAAPSETVEGAALPAPAPPPANVADSPGTQSQDEGGSAPVEPPTVPLASTGLVTFDLPSMVVSNRAVVAAIPLRHLSSTPRDVSVKWRIIEGSARPGRDYGGPESGVETFVAGNNFRILYVPLVSNPPATRDRTFVVELTAATPGVEVGGAPRVAVTILGDG